MNDMLGISYCTCQNCHKRFERLSLEWTYNISLGGNRYDYYCSYSCWTQALEDRRNQAAKARSFRMTEDQKQMLFRMLDEGRPQEEIVKALNVSGQLVRYYRKKRP